jgi:predicted Zn-dependent protease
MKKKQPINRDPKVNAYVKCVADQITNALPERQAWEVVVFEVAEPNAFALPGGKIGVHTGMLKVAKDPGQLAAVLGHEVGHVLAHHSNERVSESMALESLTAISTVFMNKDSKSYGVAMAALGIGSQFGIVLPHSRKQESEADTVGLDLMSKAGFDPQQAVELWRNMQTASGGAPPEFMSTHPSNATRIEQLQAQLGPAQATYAQAKNRPNCRP